MNRLFPALVGATLLLSACGGSTTPSNTPTSSRDILSFGGTLDTAYVGEAYNDTLSPLGGTGPYSVRLVSGSLPSGLKFSGGSSANISGTPTAAGNATFSLEVSDANLSVKTQSFSLSVAELPPLDFVPKLPSGELRGETRIPLSITGPRSIRAARFTWVLPEQTQVTAVQSLGGNEAGRPLVFWKQSGRNLIMDFGFRLTPQNASQVAMISLKPMGDQPINLGTVSSGATSFVLARDAAGKVLREVKPLPPALSKDAPEVSKDGSKPAANGVEPTKIDTPKVTDPAKPEVPKVETPKPNAPKADEPVQPEPPKTDAPKVADPAKPDVPKVETPKPDVPKADEPVQPEPPKTDAPKVADPAKPEGGK